MLPATPYTPVFPPSLPTPTSPASGSTSCDSSTSEDSRVIKISYIDRLKGRYISLASMPQDELCPPSREASPESESRIEALRLRMRKARELRLPLVRSKLVCCGIRGGDWVGHPDPDEEQEERQYVLPDTEEEWFQWQRKKKLARERRHAGRMAVEHRQSIAKWSEGIANAPPLQLDEGLGDVQRASEVTTVGFLAIKIGDIVSNEDKVEDTPYLAPQSPPPGGPDRDDSEPVEIRSLPLPPAPALDPLPDFSDSFSMPNSPPSLPQLRPDIPFPYDVPPSPSFALNEIQISTPPRRDGLPHPVLQLSSPISPPRSLRPLTASHTLPSQPTKRPRDGDEPEPDVPNATEEPSTPRMIKKARTFTEPITPASVPRPIYSQERTHSPNFSRLPTLTALLASSRKSPRGRSRIAETPRRDATAVPTFSPSQPTYSMFRPQFQSTQAVRAKSLPLSEPPTTQPISPLRSSGPLASSSSIGFYQSQFNVEDKIEEVAAFLDKDVTWNP